MIRETLLRRLYPRVVEGLPGLGTPAVVLARYRAADGSVRADALDRRYLQLAGSTGFLAGLPGPLALPVTVPADLVATALLQLHLAATYAHAGGRTLRETSVRERCIGCVLGRRSPEERAPFLVVSDPAPSVPAQDAIASEERRELFARAASKLGQRFAGFAVSSLTRAAARRGATRLGLRRVPLIGGFVSAGANLVLTLEVAHCARSVFLPELVTELEQVAPTGRTPRIPPS